MSEGQLKELFEKNTSLIERTSLANSANDKVLKVATVTFSKEPSCLWGRKEKNGLLKDILHLDDPNFIFNSIEFDDGFEGLTRLNEVSSESLSAELVTDLLPEQYITEAF